MNKKIYSVAVALSLCTSTAFASTYIDETTKKDDLNRKDFISNHRQKCIDMDSYQKSKECIAKVLDEAKKDYPKRGTEEYAQANYAGMSEDQAYSQLKQLQALSEKAKGNSTGTYSREPGEISVQEISNEGWWLQNNVLGVADAAGDPWFKACDNQPTSSVVVRCELGE